MNTKYHNPKIPGSSFKTMKAARYRRPKIKPKSESAKAD